MGDVATSLSRYAGRRVFDRTGLAGRYDFELAWSEEVSIFTALSEQLGVKLEAERGPSRSSSSTPSNVPSRTSEPFWRRRVVVVMHLRLQWLVFAAAMCLAVFVSSARAQRPSFEAASVKRNLSGSDSASVRGQSGRVTITNNPLRNIIRNAWGLQGFQIVGGPDWINTERWDIVAKAEGNPPGPQMMTMVQNLLADRFKLVAHRETREMPIYALVLARADRTLGPNLHSSPTDCLKEMTAAVARGGGPPRDGKVLCGMRVLNGHIVMNAESMNNFVRNLSPIAGRSVVDKTGLAGGFDADLTWAPDAALGPGAENSAAPADGPSLFTAIQEQLGLKLDAQRGPVDVLVIDSVERPIED